MRWTELLTPFRPECDDATDLLAAAGYTHRLADGLYTLLPLGQRVLARLNAIIRGEMARVGAQEITMPLLQPAALWNRPNADAGTRADAFGSQLLRVSVTGAEPLVLSPTHEEVASVVAGACIGGERDLPRVVYQIQPRFRHQACHAEDGLLHTREFVMADAYSFHVNRASLDATYSAMKHALLAVVSACGVSARYVAADGGAIGGDESEELVAPLPSSASEAAVYCISCGYAASIELATFARQRRKATPLAPLEEVADPQASQAQRLVWIPFVTRGQIILGVFPRGQLLSLEKLGKALARAGVAAPDLHPASAHELSQLGASYDTISLIRTPRSVLIVGDEALRSDVSFCIPSSRAGHVLVNVNTPRDFRIDLCADICAAREGAGCSSCGAALSGLRGVEIGHIFKLGTHYMRELATQPGARAVQMGCYGLGVTRLMATIVEQHRDARGIVWPERVAPFLAAIVAQGPEASPAALQLYRELSASGLQVLFFDSPEAAADKIARADRLGIPFQVVVPAAGTGTGTLELRHRTTSQTDRLSATDLRARLNEYRTTSA
jgi:prolyl-tRNA synthetase